MMKKKEILILSIVLGVSLWLLFYLRGQSSQQTGEILYDGKVLNVFDLQVPSIFSLDEKNMVVFEIKAGKIAFIHSDCPDQQCVKTGFISRPWETATCLPNRLTIRMEHTTRKDEPDMVVFKDD